MHILYKNDAMTVCDRDDHVQIFVVLAKFIRTIDDDRTLNNDADLVRFGAQLADQRYRLREQQCRNYLILVGVESAKLAYFKVRIRIQGGNLKYMSTCRPVTIFDCQAM